MPPPHRKATKLPDCLTRAEASALATELHRRGTRALAGNVRQNVADAMRVARVRPAIIRAYLRTGLLVTESTLSDYSPDQLRAWETAARQR